MSVMPHSSDKSETNCEYDPTLSGHPEDAKAYKNSRPSNNRRIYDLRLGKIFQVWPDYPMQVVRYGKYCLRWYTRSSATNHYAGYRNQDEVIPQVSVDEKDWVHFDTIGYKPTKWSNRSPGPQKSWWDKDELRAEIVKKHKEFKRKRSRMLAKVRKENLRKEAMQAGVKVNEYIDKKAMEDKKKREKKRRLRAGEQMADNLGRKIKLAMALKDLYDETAGLREKLKDETRELDLTYIDNKIDKITTATRTLKHIGHERNKK